MMPRTRSTCACGSVAPAGPIRNMASYCVCFVTFGPVAAVGAAVFFRVVFFVVFVVSAMVRCSLAWVWPTRTSAAGLWNRGSVGRGSLVFVVELVHRRLDASLCPGHDRAARAGYRRVQQLALLGREFPEHVILSRDGRRGWVDAEPQPRVLNCSYRALDVAQSVMTSRAP